MILRKHITGITKSDSKILGNGFWMTLVFLAGKIIPSLVYSGVMEPVCYPRILHLVIRPTTNSSSFTAGSGKTVLAYAPEDHLKDDISF